MTHDEISQPERRCSATIEQLVYGVLISYSSYISPVSGRPCEVEDVIDYIATQKEKYAKI